VVNGPSLFAGRQSLRWSEHGCAISFTPGVLVRITRPAASRRTAEWVIHVAEWDLWPLDRRRYTAYANVAYTKARAVGSQNECARIPE
jgi:hypothetical protein